MSLPMTLSQTLEDVAPEPKTIESVSLFYSNEGENSDKEYHMQLLDTGNGFVVHSQHGRRGSKLRHIMPQASPTSLWQAQNVYSDLLKDKERKGYEHVPFFRLEQVYGILRSHNMDAAGIDLFMEIRGKQIGMADYARQAGDAARSQYPIICSYTAARSMGDVMAGMPGLTAAPDEEATQQGLDLVRGMLQRHGLARIGIFVGKNKDGEVLALTGSPMAAVEPTQARRAGRAMRP